MGGGTVQLGRAENRVKPPIQPQGRRPRGLRMVVVPSPRYTERDTARGQRRWAPEKFNRRAGPELTEKGLPYLAKTEHFGGSFGAVSESFCFSL